MKKVNRVIQNNIQKHDTVQEIQRKAASKSEISFQDQFLHMYTRGFSLKDLSMVSGKAAELTVCHINSWTQPGKVQAGWNNLVQYV